MAENYLLRGKVEHVDGEWLLGDKLPAGHPGRIEPNDPRGLLFKVWRAQWDPEKYRRTPDYPGWEPQVPVHGGRTETVEVIIGFFGCKEEFRREKLLSPGERVALDADTRRQWFLPAASHGAAGITLCRHLPGGYPSEFGQGVGYEYYSFVRPLCFPQWFSRYIPDTDTIRYKLIVFFEGEVVDAFRPFITLGAFEYAFFEKDAFLDCVIAKPNTSFVILYF